ncbi:Ig-like domain-containing protein [Erwinia sp. Leaf53]|uniref:Ig-like domain-containing protein n=1 Tax=Erwinia sp. Leaf53 TaxID=1736225 RepID=UPI001F1BA701|nr:Ig-like domain-containing protein [Erwinia sp. Leaf53]
MTGNGEPGATVNVRSATGALLGTSVVEDDGTFSVTLNAAQQNGETLSVTLIDAANNTSDPTTYNAPDNITPDAPTDLLLDAAGLVLTGKGEAGNTVKVYGPNGNVIASDVVADDGTFSITLPAAQINGEQLTITQTDPANHVSQPGSVTALDTVTPDAPTAVEINDSGTVVTGQGEAGTIAKVYDALGNQIGSATVDSDGSFTVAISPAQTNGESLTVTLTDGANHISPAGEVDAPDTTTPDAPTDLALDATGLILTGRGEAGDTIVVHDAKGNVVSTTPAVVTVAPDGTFTLTLPSAQLNGETLTVTQTDPAGHTSASETIVAEDILTPDAPTDVAIDDTGSVITGKGEPGTTVIVYNALGNSIANSTVLADGTFSVTLPTPLTNGEELTVGLIDGVGHISQPSPVITAPDTTTPDAPTDLALDASGTVLTGRGEAGDTIIVHGADGNVLTTIPSPVIVEADGSFSLTLDSAQLNGQTLTVTQTDPVGHVSPAASYLADDTETPDAPTGVAINDAGTEVTGRGEPGTTVNVTNAQGGVIGTGTVLADGSFTVTLSPAQTNGQALDVTLTDGVGHVSPAYTVTAADTTTPDAPTDLTFDAFGIVLSGKGEPGDTILVRDANGIVLTTDPSPVTVNGDGTFSLTLLTAQLNGETLTVTQTDPAGHVSPSTAITAVDITTPDAPTGVAIDDTGTLVTGRGEAGTTVNVTNALGTVILGTAIVQSDGSFSVTLNPAQTNGETLAVTLTDGEGQTSTPATVDATDTTTPDAPTDLALDATGVVLTGRGEAGNTIIVHGANGNALTTDPAVITVDADGNFTLALTTAQLNGQVLTVTQTDPVGHVSPAASYTADDTTNPDSPTNLNIADDGVTLTGRGEAGTTVTVRDASNNLIGTGSVEANGSFTIILTEPQDQGLVVNVVLTDAAGLSSPVTPVTSPGPFSLDAPTDLQVSPDGLTVTGRAETAGLLSTTIVVKNAAGVTVGTAVLLISGGFTVTLDSPQVNGEVLYVSVQNTGANLYSPAATVTALDITTPDAPTDLLLSDNGLILTGRGEAGDVVTVKNAAGSTLGFSTVAADGTFSVTLSGAQLNGQVLSVTQTDPVGHVSPAATTTANDTTTPDAPTNLDVIEEGTRLTGLGEPGATVTVRNASGTLLVTTQVDTDGTFSVILSPAQANGETLTVTQTDAAGLTSPAANVIAEDITTPDAPTDLAVSANGLVLTGNGEAGDTVTVRNAAGTALGTALVASNGTFSVNLSAAQLNGQVLSVTQTDPAGHTSPAGTTTAADITTPDAPTNLVLSDNGLFLSGRGEAGDIVTVKSAAGAILGTATVLADGTFSVELSAAQLNGQVLSVSQTDPVGHVSASATLNAADTITPDAPVVTALSANGLVLTGTGEAGDTVVVKNAAGTTLGTVQVGADGTFSVNLSPAQLNGQVLSVTQTDPAGHISAATPYTAADVTTPDAPTNLALSANGLVLTGRGEAGDTVTVKSAAGVTLGTTVVLADGTFSVELSAAQLNGQVLNVTQTDPALHVSPAASYTAADVTTPDAPVVTALSVNGLVLTGTGEAGDTVNVKSAAGITLGTAIVLADGSWSATLSPAQLNGQVLSVTQTDPVGHISAATPYTAADVTTPDAPTNLALSADGLTLTGRGEAGDTVTVKSAAGVTLGTAVVLADGTFSVGLSAAQLNGQVLSVTQTDPALHVSPVAPYTAADITTPDAPVVTALSANGLVLTGTGEAGDTVIVKSAAGVTLGTALVAANGSFSVTLGSAQLNGQVLSVTQTDPVGHVSAATPYTAADVTTPDAPTNLALSPDGLTLTGRGEAGDTVTVRTAAGVSLGTTIVLADGTFSVGLSAAQLNGQVLSVTQTDPALHVSPAAGITASDSTSPDAPTALTLSADGLTLSGRGEAGDTITVKSLTGVTLGTGLVLSDGTFTATLSPAQLNGQVLSVIQTDPVGQVSQPASYTAADVTTPDAPTGLTLAANGITLTGRGEAGDTITVKSAAGVTLGTTVVAADGTFTATLSPAQLNGQVLSVTQTDPALHVSPAGSVTAADVTTPDAPTNLALAADGITLTGRGEAGDTVIVKNAAGTTLGTALVLADGTFTATLSPAQLNGQVLSVSY